MFWKEEVRKAASPVRGYCVVQVSGGRDLNGSSGDGLSCCGCKQYISDNLTGNLDKLDLGIEREGRVKVKPRGCMVVTFTGTGSPERDPVSSGPDMLGWRGPGGDWNSSGLELGQAH